MNDFALIVVSQVIEAQAVCLFVNQFFQLSFQLNCLGFIHAAFEDGVLYPLSMGGASSGHLPEYFPPGSGGGIQVIGYKEEHSITSRERGDIRPGHDGCIEPEEAPVHRESVPRPFFPAGRGG